jgi:hypothetical protein
MRTHRPAEDASGRALARLFAILVFPSLAAAQDPRPQVGRVVAVDLALAATPAGAGDALLVRRPGASFLQLRITDVRLPAGGSVEVQAPHEPRPETLDAATIAAAGGMTLLHGGDTLAVRLRPAPGHAASARIDLVAEGFRGAAHAPLSLCGNDTRVASTDRHIARLVITETSGVYYGTAFLIDPVRTMATAGHNVAEADLLSVIAEFDVPASLADGTPQPAALENQYRWEGLAAVRHEYVPGGPDWGVLRLQRNAATNLWPAVARGGFLRLAQEPPAAPRTLRVAGHGHDTARPARALTQQRADGPFVGRAGSELRYRIDTEPGASGAPLSDPATGLVFGVHVRGGCSAAAGTFNAATGNDHGAFAAARVALAGGSADLSIDAFTADAGAQAGGAVRVQATVRNAVEGSAPWVRYGFYLSATGTLDAGARLLGPTFLFRSFIVRATTSPTRVSHDLAVPADLDPGRWQLGMWIDNFAEVIEADEGNNVRWLPLQVSAPAASTRTIECQHTLGGRSHLTETWAYAALPNRGHAALPVARGGEVAFAVTAPSHAGDWSLCAWSGLSAQPFLPDAYTELGLGALNSAVFARWLARLDASGRAYPRFHLPPAVAAPHPGLYVKAFFVRSDFGAIAAESSDWVLLTLGAD